MAFYDILFELLEYCLRNIAPFLLLNTLSPLNKGLFQIRVYITVNVYAGIVKVNPSGKLVIQRYVDKFFFSWVKFTARTIEAIRTKLTYTFIKLIEFALCFFR